MATVIAHKCKTPGCNAWIRLSGDSSAEGSIPLRTDESVRITCWRCKEGHEYFPGEKRSLEAQNA